MQLHQLSDSDGTWARLKEVWAEQCAAFGESIEEYAPGTFTALDPLAAEDNPKAGIYALFLDEEEENPVPNAVCQLNRTGLPGYQGLVLRVRFLTLAPKYDFGDVPVKEYGDLLASLFIAIIDISNSDLEAPHLKFHLKSPADRQFFAAGSEALAKIPHFQSVAVKGAWLYVTKA